MDTQEYETIMVDLEDGSQGEFAIVDRFDYKEKHYVVVAQVVDDTVSEEGLFIYQAEEEEESITITKITADIYAKVAEYYMSLE